ncbi:MAG: hypothetical protein NT091_05380, partial [Candidatus Falkowbacteria bacterium]|nr:hypothetical protein [Candidatus Falkowbacteria bacterium]
TKINISGGFANLITKDQTDNDNTASGFGGGTYSNTQWYATSTWVGLPTATATGDFTSRIMDVGGDVAWSTINWTTALPNYKELPNNAATETAYSLSNANMSGNVLLTHMNESSGAINDTSGNSNNGTNNNATYSSTGRFNTALNFNGTTSNVSIPDASSLNMSAAFTAEAWVKFGSTFNSSSGANMGLLDKGAYQLFFDKNDGKLKFSLTANATSTWTLNYNGGCSIVRSMAVYNNKLYAGMSGVAGCNDVYSFDGVNWTISYDGAGPASSFTALAVYNGKLYAGQGGSAGYNDVYSFDGTSF